MSRVLRKRRIETLSNEHSWEKFTHLSMRWVKHIFRNQMKLTIVELNVNTMDLFLIIDTQNIITNSRVSGFFMKTQQEY